MGGSGLTIWKGNWKKIILIIIILCKHTHTLSLLSFVHSLKTRISKWMQALKIIYININFSPFSFSFFYSFSLIIDFILIKHSQNKIRILFFGLTRRPFLYFRFYAFNKNSLKKIICYLFGPSKYPPTQHLAMSIKSKRATKPTLH